MQTLLPLIASLVAFGVLVTVHECGHFLFCKLFNVDTPIFSIGFGPVLFKRVIGRTEFRLSLIPLGGFCAVAGAELPGEGDEHESSDEEHIPFERTFVARNFFQKFLILMGGILCNLLLAYALFTAVNYGTLPVTTPQVVITHIAPESTAAYYDIRKNDIIIGYNNTPFSLTEQDTVRTQVTAMLSTIQGLTNEAFTLHLKRGTELIKKEVIINKTLGVSLAQTKAPVEGKTITNSLRTAFKTGVALTHSCIAQTATALKGIFSSRSLRGMGGPLMILSSSFGFAQEGMRALWEFIATISINLALLNLIPFGPLDGGQLIFLVAEWVIRRPLPTRAKEIFLTATWYLFIGLFIFLTYRDILRLF